MPFTSTHPEVVERFFETSRRNLGLDYVGPYLVHTHTPVGVTRVAKVARVANMYGRSYNGTPGHDFPTIQVSHLAEFYLL